MNTKKLTLEKFRIAKLNNSSKIIGGGDGTIYVTTVLHVCKKESAILVPAGEDQ